LDFGVIGFDAQGIVRRYNTYESRAAGLSTARVLGYPLFTVVAPCINKYLVAQRFEDAADADGELDATIDYVLTLRMRPVKAQLRLLAAPGGKLPICAGSAFDLSATYNYEPSLPVLLNTRICRGRGPARGAAPSVRVDNPSQ
jgi:photoactive yellow protein